MRRYLYVKVWKLPYYVHIPTGLLLLNWIVQRIFKINIQVPFSVHYTSKVQGIEQMELGEKAKLSLAISGGAFIKAFEGSKLTIGEETIFANNVTIHTANHDPKDRSKFIMADITIGRNCWLGSGVTVLSGVTLGDNVTVGANSVVTKSFSSNCVIAGCPAKIIKTL
jgi:acetyltransferase-like isoleucine patch superfamily enzyme